MQRREFVIFLGGAGLSWPLAARAQPPAPAVIGVLSSGGLPDWSTPRFAAFLQGLSETGHVKGRNVAFEYRLAEGRYERLPELAADLVRRRVAVLFVIGGPQTALAARTATPTIPIVFAIGADPVRSGLAASLNRPSGNVTGVSFLSGELDRKRLSLLHELVPRAGLIGVLVNPGNPTVENQSREFEEAARALGLQLRFRNVSTVPDIDEAFAALSQQRAEAILFASDPFFFIQRRHIIALAARHSLPAIYEFREAAEDGGLASYGTSLADAYRQAGIYIGRILKGEKPAELPIVQSSKFELILNLRTAKALGLAVPPALLARADEVID